MTRETIEKIVKENVVYKCKCPRCSSEIKGYPALSRYADVNICSDCGVEEAMNGWFGIENNFDTWTM